MPLIGLNSVKTDWNLKTTVRVLLIKQRNEECKQKAFFPAEENYIDLKMPVKLAF
jgi:hypothetical protein